jgi:hypothetical protein
MINQLPVSMTVYYTGQRLFLGINNGHVMTTLKNISPTVLNLQNIENTLNISQ